MPRAHGQKIGWIDGNGLYLHPALTYQLVVKMAKQSDQPLNLSEKMLWQHFDMQGLLISKEKHRGLKVRKMCEGKQVDVLHLAVGCLQEPTNPTNLSSEGDREAG